jgi:2'-5' RNA ligase
MPAGSSRAWRGRREPGCARTEGARLDADGIFRELPELAARESLRAFVAIEIPESLRERCAAIGRRIARDTGGVSWVRPANLHLTLKFLGGARPAQLERLAESLAHKAAKTEPFEVELAGLGCFPSARRARVIWIGVAEGGEPLRALADKVEGAAAKAGFDREARPFSGHLTLGRVRMKSDGTGRGDLSDLIAREDPGVLGRFGVTEVVLMHSRLHPGGSVYIPIHRIALGRAGRG